MDIIVKKIIPVGPGEIFIRLRMNSDVEFDSEWTNTGTAIKEGDSVIIDSIRIFGEISPSPFEEYHWDISKVKDNPKLESVSGKIVEINPPNMVRINVGIMVTVFHGNMEPLLKSQGIQLGDWVVSRCLAPPHVIINKDTHA